jgi:hypothetical protein
MKYRVLVSVALLSSACSHVSLHAPSREAPDAERIAAYERLQPAAEVHTLRVRTSDNVVVDVDSSMILADGTTVHEADDLLQVVDNDSASARAARRSSTARKNKWIAYLTGTSVMAAGFAYSWYGIDKMGDDAGGDLGTPSEIYVGLGVATVGMVVYLVGQFHYRKVEQDERRAAFVTYPEGLRERLAVCVDGMRVIACQ